MTPRDLADIRTGTGASAVLSLQHEECLKYWNIDLYAMRCAAADLGLPMARWPIRDFDIPDMRKNLPDAVSLLSGLLCSGHRTYVHCTAGMGRAPLVALAHMIWAEGLPREEAARRLSTGRPEAVPAWEALDGASADLEGRHREKIERRAYALFQAGTYRDPVQDWLRAKSDVFSRVLPISCIG
jgi:hypothetical protein